MAKREIRQVVPSELLSKEFLSQFKTEEDVSQFLKDLHSQVLEQMLEGEMDSHLGYEKHSLTGNNSGNSRNGSFTKKIQTEHGESVISIPRDRNSDFEPIVVPKHQSRGLSIRTLDPLSDNQSLTLLMLKSTLSHIAGASIFKCLIISNMQ